MEKFRVPEAENGDKSQSLRRNVSPFVEPYSSLPWFTEPGIT
jgi:hypothetical protein